MRKPILTKIVASLAIAIVFCCCKKPTEFKEIEVPNLFSLQVPAYLKSTDKLIPFTASNIQQYQDSAGKICLLVFDTSRSIEIGTLRTFYDSMIANPVLDSAKITPVESVNVDNDSAYRSEITGIHNDVRVFGEIETIATKNRYYYMLVWSSLDRREELKPDLYKMLNSFKDLSHSKK